MEKLTQKNDSIKIKINTKISSLGSLEGFKNLLADSTDIAMSSNKISPEMRAKFRENNTEYVEYILAGDALVFVVNVNNPIKKLNEIQLINILNGNIKNWKQVGGKDLPINVLSRDIKSGTYSFLKETVLKSTNLVASAKIYQSNEEIIEDLSKDESAISFTNFSSLNYSVDPLSISFDNNSIDYIAPRSETVNNMKYKYLRGLYLYYKPENYQKIKPLMEVLNSDVTQKLISKSGYIIVTNKLAMK
jgi:phosphate transport system substrate-binding protein